MKNLKINLAFLHNRSEESNKLYLDYLINVIVAYLLVKGGNVMISPNSDKVNAVLCLDSVLISLRDFFGRERYFSLGRGDYYLKNFLNQDVVVADQFADMTMMECFGIFSPRVIDILSYSYVYFPSYEHGIFDGFIKGIDSLNKQYILDGNQRIIALDNGLQTLSLSLDVEQQELFNLALASIEKQPEAPYYLFFHEEYQGIVLKLTKQQYLRILRYYIWTPQFHESDHIYRDILKGGADNALIEFGEMPYASLHLIFPQIFPEFDLQTGDIFNEYHLCESNLFYRIFRPYFAKLIFKHFVYLTTNTTFFSTYSEYFKDITYDLDQITTMLNNMTDDEVVEIGNSTGFFYYEVREKYLNKLMLVGL